MALVHLRQHVESSVLACFGVPTPLGPMGINDGTAQREALRRFWTLTVQPLADLIAEELARVLERPVTLAIGRAAGVADVAGRARAVKALTRSGHRQGERDAPRKVVGMNPHPRCADSPSPGGGPRVCCGFGHEGAPCYLHAEPFPPLHPVDVNAPHPFIARAARYFDAVGRALDAGATVDQAIAAAREAVRG